MKLNRGEKAVLLFLDSFANGNGGKATPSFRAIAAATDYCDRQARRIVERLVEKGIIEKQARRDRRKMIRANRYYLTQCGQEILASLKGRTSEKDDDDGMDILSIGYTPEQAPKCLKDDDDGMDILSREVYIATPEASLVNHTLKPLPELEPVSTANRSTLGAACPFSERCRPAVNALQHQASSECATCYQVLTRESLYGVLGIPAEPRMSAESFARQMQADAERRALQAIAELRQRHA